MNGEKEKSVAEDLWSRVKEIYLTTLSSEDERSQAKRYFGMIKSVSVDNNTMTFKTSTSFAADLLKNDYSERIKKCLGLVDSSLNYDLEFKEDKTIKINITGDERKPENRIVKKHSSFISTMPLKEVYTFDEFVKGPSNSWAHAAAKGVATNPGKDYNPLFIYGGTGLGKTHLMQAIGNEIIAKLPEKNVCYLTAEVFLNKFVTALQNGTLTQFRERYRSIDVLLVDDIQFIAQRKHFQEEFFNTFNSLHSSGKQIVLTSDVAPKNLHDFEQRLISRFEGGMVQEIEVPTFETRLAILRKKTEGSTPQVPDTALVYIAENINSHVRAMEGALDKVKLMMKINPSIEFNNDILERLLKDFIEKEKNIKKLTIEDIQKETAKYFSVTIAHIISSERTQNIVTPRQLSMYIARKFTTINLKEIGVKFDKSYPTIIHGTKTIEKRLENEPDLHNALVEILNVLGCSIADKVE